MWPNGYFTSSAVVVASRCRPSSSAAIIVVRRCPCRPPPSSVSISKIHTSAFYPLHPQISNAKFIRNLPVATSAHLHFTIGLGQLVTEKQL